MDIKPTVVRTGNDIGANVSTTQSAGKRTGNAPPAQGAGETNQSGSPDLTLTNTARNMLEMQSSVSKVADVDLAKVEEIRRSIEEGTYEINSAKLADNLIQSSLELP